MQWQPLDWSLAMIVMCKDQSLMNRDQEKIYIIHIGVWPSPQKVKLKCGKILNQGTLNQDSTVYYSTYETKTSLIIDVFSGDLYFLLVSSLLCFLYVLI
jgi:hypothetical protein